MDISLNPKDEAFREGVRTFLEENLTDEMRASTRLNNGLHSPNEAAHRDWHHILYDKGWIAPSWPKEFGGPGWDVMQRYIFRVESMKAGVPQVGGMGVAMIGPAIMGHGNQEQKDYYLPRILKGDDRWCQGYSEPGAGSDLASLQTRAEPDGDDYIVNGTKIWTSGAHHANRMFCLVRTSSEGKKQEGITFLLIDMQSPGIEVRPIYTIAGTHHLNQVFFDDVRVPQKNRVGRENEGWTVAKYLLEFERGGGSYATGVRGKVDALKSVASLERASDGGRLVDDPGFAARLSRAEIDLLSLQFTEHRIMSALSTGERPGPESSVMKTTGSELGQRIDELAIEAIGYYGAAYQPEAHEATRNVEVIGPEHGLMLMSRYLNNRASTIYAGSSEVQRNIIAKAVLGL